MYSIILSMNVKENEALLQMRINELEKQLKEKN